MTTKAHTLKSAGPVDGRPVELSVTYRQSDGELRMAVVAVDLNNLWAVYDIPVENTDGAAGIVVEQLTGAGERLGQALGVLVNYVEDQVAFHNGERERFSPESPLACEPQRADLEAIGLDAKRALKAVEADRHRGSDSSNTEWLRQVRDLAERQQAAVDTEPQAQQQPGPQQLAA